MIWEMMHAARDMKFCCGLSKQSQVAAGRRPYCPFTLRTHQRVRKWKPLSCKSESLKTLKITMRGTVRRGISSLIRFLKSRSGLSHHQASRSYWKIVPTFLPSSSSMMERLWGRIIIGNVFGRNSSTLDCGVLWFERQWQSGIWKLGAVCIS